MKWIDVTLPMEEGRPSWPGDTPFAHRVTREIGKGSNANVSTIESSVHFGTHLDAPYHFIADGKRIEDLDLNVLIGPCQVVEVPSTGVHVDLEALKQAVAPGIKRLLIKTSNSKWLHDREFHKDYVALSVQAARWLVDRGIRLVGIDYFSIGPYGDTKDVHHIILGNDIIALEGVDLSDVEPGMYYLLCLPMKIKGAGGAPVRVLLGAEE
ncbi:MAG: cyclase family protein [Clostridiales bacterium]|jgi:arylformamidase|nr:cyclase family protein [Clostridiales bacterium]